MLSPFPYIPYLIFNKILRFLSQCFTRHKKYTSQDADELILIFIAIALDPKVIDAVLDTHIAACIAHSLTLYSTDEDFFEVIISLLFALCPLSPFCLPPCHPSPCQLSTQHPSTLSPFSISLPPCHPSTSITLLQPPCPPSSTEHPPCHSHTFSLIHPIHPQLTQTIARYFLLRLPNTSLSTPCCSLMMTITMHICMEIFVASSFSFFRYY